jgi:primosomal protein N' (replication factor Y)
MSDAVEIAIPLPGNQTYYYSFPRSHKNSVLPGARVQVPFRNRVVIGYIIGFGKPPEDIKLKEIIDVVDDAPLFDEERLEYYKWLADYYSTSIGMILKIAHPGGLGTTLRRFINLTDKGKKVLDINAINKESSILNTISSSESITVEKLFQIVEDTGFNDLNRLLKKGLIEYRYELKEFSPKYRNIVNSVETDDEVIAALKKKMPAKGQIAEYVSVHKNISEEDLREIFPNVKSHLAWLNDNGLIELVREEVFRDPFKNISPGKPEVPKLTIEQETALKKIYDSIDHEEYSTFLLHGVTGSGKTEVYLRAISNVIEMGKEAIVLVPEISLTPLLVKRFRNRFGDKVAVIHSLLSEGERFDAWRRARDGRVKIIIGARSAVFAPFKNIGIIIIDEEHETTYKQDDSPFYNARDAAIMLGRMSGAVVILGSATPSIESYSNSLKHKYTYLSLPLRVTSQSLPDVHVIDMKKSKGSIFSNQLEREIVTNFDNENQSIIFLNRRGFSTLLILEDSGEIFSCPNCSIPFTYHKDDNTIKCHYCGSTENFDVIKKNTESRLKGIGIGTQLVEHELKKLLPQARIQRMDRDTTGTKAKLMNLYSDLEDKKVDILVGTQMVTKGHDLPGVTLVGVVSADNLLGIPDFRSGERTFQMITQVAGRAGRGNLPGRVIVQTYNPSHPSIKYAVNQDSTSFLKNEIKLREYIGYPPFTRIVNFRFSGTDENEIKSFIKKCEIFTKKAISKLNPNAIELLGPSQCPIYKIKNRYRFQMLLKSENIKLLHGLSKGINGEFAKQKSNIRIQLDIDPYNFS